MDRSAPPVEYRYQADSGQLSAGPLNFAPTSRVTVPEVTDWHLVADHELESIAKKEGGIFGAIGFTAVGAALGAWPLANVGLSKVGHSQVASPEAVSALIVFLLGLGVGIVCLAVFTISKFKTKSTLKIIRERKTVSGISSKVSE